MLTEFPGLLLWGVPGVIVWLLSFGPILRAAHNGGRPSPCGLRLNLVGMGLIVLGWDLGLVLAALARSEWGVALLFIAAAAWLPVLLLWLAARLRVTAGS